MKQHVIVIAPKSGVVQFAQVGLDFKVLLFSPKLIKIMHN